MKLFKYLLAATILIFSLVSCSSDDTDPVNQVEEDMAWLNFTINGEIMNGEYRIDYNPESTDAAAIAALVPHPTLPDEYVAMVGYHDDNQNLLTNIVFLANEAILEFDNFSLLAGISGFLPFVPENPMSINLTQLETINVVYSPEPLISKIAANFSGIVVAENSNTGDKFYHTIQGDFYLQVQHEDVD